MAIFVEICKFQSIFYNIELKFFEKVEYFQPFYVNLLDKIMVFPCQALKSKDGSYNCLSGHGVVIIRDEEVELTSKI